MKTPITVKWSAKRWQYVAIGLNEQDTEILNDLLSLAESNDSALIKARAYEQSLANSERCNSDLIALVDSL